MRNFILSFGFGIKQIFTAKRYLFMLALLFITSLISIAVYSEYVVRDIRVSLLDLDNSKLSRTLRHYIDSSREITLVNTQAGSMDELRTQLETGLIKGAILIPKNFSSRIKRGQRGQVVVAMDLSNILLGKLGYKVIEKSIGTIAAGIQIQLVSKLGDPGDQAMARVLPIQIAESYNFNPATNYMVYMGPALLFFFLHVYILILTSSLFIPYNRPVGIAAFLGRCLSIFIVGVTLGLFFLYAILPIFLPYPQSSFAVLLLLCAVFVGLAIMMALGIGLLAPQPMLSMQMTVIIGMLSLMFSGVTWPMDMFPAPIKAAAGLIPFTPFASGLRISLHAPAGFDELGHVYQQFGYQMVVFGFMIGLGIILINRQKSKVKK